MAGSTVLREAARSAHPADARRLFDLALGLLVDHVTGTAPGSWRFGPLVIVAAADDAATAALGAAAASRGVSLAAGAVMTWTGATFTREIALARENDRLAALATVLAASRLVVVDRMDRVTGDDALQALAHLYDASTGAGATWCVSIPEVPATGLVPQVASRLGGGLVVRAAPPTADATFAGSAPSPARVFRAVARLHDLPVEEILGPSRRRTVALARSLAMYLARRITGASFQAIGTACGGRDHTTVLHGVRVCTDRIARDPAFAADVERLTATLTGTAPAARVRRRPGVGSATLARAVGKRRRQRRRPA